MKHAPHSRSRAPSGKPGKFSPRRDGGKKHFYTAKPKDGATARYPDARPPAQHDGYPAPARSGKPERFPSSFSKDRGKKRFAPKHKDGRPEKHADARPDFHKPDFRKPDFPKKKFRKEFRRPERDDRARPTRDAVKPQHTHLKRLPEKPERDSVLIWGLHAARAAWLNPKRRCFRLWVTEAGKASFEASFAEANELLLKRPDPKQVERHELDKLAPPGSVHQGIMLEAAPLHEPPLHEVIGGDNPPDLLLMLDQVTDPHNVGAILRSAAAFGAGAVIMTERNAPIMTGVQAKAASGATEHVPHIHVVNLARTLDELQKAGYWCVGLAEEGEKDLSALDLSGRTVLVLGAEGEGLRHLTRQKCDELAKLPTGGPIGSLNVSNAAAVALYEVRRQKNAFK